MKISKFLNNAASHVCIICSIALLIIFVLDWYNPFMDFLGHAKILLFALSISSIYLGVCERRNA